MSVEEIYVAKRLRAALREAGLSVVDVAPRVGMGASTLYRKLKRGRGFTFGEIAVLAALAGRHPSDMMQDRETE